MGTKGASMISDIPKEGHISKRVEVLLSPSQSEIDSQIACADPRYVEEIRKEVETMQMLRTERLGGRSIGGDSQRQRSLKDRTVEEVELGIKNPTRNLFGEFVNPLDLLSFFHNYDPNVLTDGDMNTVRATALMEGKTAGSTELYDLLQNYEGWLPCTVDVLRDEQINMNEFAELLLLSTELEKDTNAIFENAENADRILSALREKFSMALKPLEILHLFHKYDPNVLVQEDLDAVTAITLKDGDQVGSSALLDRLITYKGWYPCLMKVLRDKAAGLEGMADELANLMSEEFEEIKECQNKAQQAFMARVAQIKEQGKGVRRRRRMKTIASIMTTDELTYLESIGQKSYKPRKSKVWEELMKATNRCPKYPGLDWNRELAPHSLDHLPSDIESANQRVQLIFDSEKDEAVPCPGLHEKTLDPWAEGEKYAEKYALTELLTFMLTRLILDTPSNPVDYLIGLSREINRLDTIRKEVDELAEAKKRCEMEMAQRKSSATDDEQDEKASVESQLASTDTAAAELKVAQQSESAKLTEYTDYTETTEITDENSMSKSMSELDGKL